MQEHLHSLRATVFPYKEFLHNISVFMEALLMAQPFPLLVQLEKGKVHGLTPLETAGLVRSCGFFPHH